MAENKQNKEQHKDERSRSPRATAATKSQDFQPRDRATIQQVDTSVEEEGRQARIEAAQKFGGNGRRSTCSKSQKDTEQVNKPTNKTRRRHKRKQGKRGLQQWALRGFHERGSMQNPTRRKRKTESRGSRPGEHTDSLESPEPGEDSGGSRRAAETPKSSACPSVRTP